MEMEVVLLNTTCACEIRQCRGVTAPGVEELLGRLQRINPRSGSPGGNGRIAHVDGPFGTNTLTEEYCQETTGT